MQAMEPNINFGMAMHSPNKNDMRKFKRFIAKNGEIDTAALGDFVMKQANNTKADIRFISEKNRDILEIFPVKNPKQVKIVDCGQRPKQTFLKRLIQGIKNLLHIEFKYKAIGSMDNLPKELIKAGEIANKMEKELN